MVDEGDGDEQGGCTHTHIHTHAHTHAHTHHLIGTCGLLQQHMLAFVEEKDRLTGVAGGRAGDVHCVNLTQQTHAYICLCMSFGLDRRSIFAIVLVRGKCRQGKRGAGFWLQNTQGRNSVFGASKVLLIAYINKGNSVFVMYERYLTRPAPPGT